MKQGRLPEDFPSHDALAAADINTFAQVRALKGDYDEVPGIGDVKGKEIDAALLAAENPEAEATGLAPAPIPETPDLDLEDLKSRATFAKPRNEALFAEIADKLGEAQRIITEATDMLSNVVHVELP